MERPDGSRLLTKMVMSGLEEPPNDVHWIGLEEEAGPIGLRRRLREKQPIRMANMALPNTQHDPEGSHTAQGREWPNIQHDREGSHTPQGREWPSTAYRATQEPQEGLKEDEFQHKKRVFQKILEEEMTLAVTEEPAALDVVLGCLAQLRQAVVKEEEDVLQTKIVAVSELRKNVQAWTPAIQAELEALFSRKEALKEIDEEEGKRPVDEGLAEVIPAKLVCTVKPDPAIKAGKKKVRIVGCGNYAEGDPDSELFAAGCHMVSLRHRAAKGHLSKPALVAKSIRWILNLTSLTGPLDCG